MDDRGARVGSAALHDRKASDALVGAAVGRDREEPDRVFLGVEVAAVQEVSRWIDGDRRRAVRHRAPVPIAVSIPPAALTGAA